MTDMVRVKLENGAEVTVPASFAEAKHLELLEVDGKPVSPYSPNGQVLDPTYPDVIEEVVAETGKLRGSALNDALTAEGLSTEGTLAEKQGRLAEHQAAVMGQRAQSGAGGTPPTDTPDGTPAVGGN